MKPISGEDILKAWSNTKLKTGVYIHSPFCKEQCTYCTFKGTMFEKDAFQRYYSEYLPNQIKFYEPILSSEHIHSYFWGGGTPTLMSAEIMNNIFGLIPNFKDCNKKIMEVHMCDWTKEKLDVLKEYNFNTVIACVQSFDREIVKQQKRRAPKNDDVIFNFLDYANSLGLFIMSDVIFFDTGNLQTDTNRLILDIQNLIDHNVSEISVQTIFDEVGKYDTLVSGIVNKFLNDNKQYCVAGAENQQFEDYFCDDTGRKCRKELKMYKKEIDWQEMSSQDMFLDGIMTSTPMIITTNYNVLGIGSYKNHKYTFSRIGDQLEYIEDGDTYNPKWMCTYDKKDWSIKKLIAEFFESLEEHGLGDLPDGIDIYFSTYVAQDDEDDSRKKRVKRVLLPRFTYLRNDIDPIITIYDYVPKLENFINNVWNEKYKE